MARSRRWLSAVVAVSGVAVGGTVDAQVPAAGFYKDRTITLMIGFGPGGGNDVWARLVARHMGRHIPGHPNIVPQNVPGAGGLALANQIYNVAPKDGTVFGNVSRGIPMEPLLGGQGTQFDPLKMSWIGSPDRDTAICVARSDAGIGSLKDIAQKELVMGATGSGTDSAIYPEFLGVLLGLRLKTVKGYKGSNEMHLAIERGEVQGMCGSHDSVMMGSQFARSGRLVILFQGRLDPDPRLKNVAYWGDIARSEEERQVLQLFLTRSALGRPFLAPPGLPPDRLATLRAAFGATMHDPAFVAEAAKHNFTVEPMSGEELAATLARAYAMPTAIVQRTREIMGRAVAK